MDNFFSLFLHTQLSYILMKFANFLDYLFHKEKKKLHKVKQLLYISLQRSNKQKGQLIWNWKCSDIYLFTILCSL